jgi:hypothetical protein
VHYLRVTVSGNNKMAESKALTIIASGDGQSTNAAARFSLFGPQQYTSETPSGAQPARDQSWSIRPSASLNAG